MARVTLTTRDRDGMQSRSALTVPTKGGEALHAAIEKRLGFRPAQIFLGESQTRIVSAEDIRNGDELRCERAHMALSLRDQETGAELTMQLTARTRLAEVFAAYSTHRGLRPGVQFQFEGARIHEDAAGRPSDHGLSSGDTLLAFVQRSATGYVGPRILRLAKFVP